MTSSDDPFARQSPQTMVPEHFKGPDADKLHRLVGRPRSAFAKTKSDDTSRLVALVTDATRDVVPSAHRTSSARVHTKRRVARRFDWLNISAAALALLAVIGTTMFATVQFASATPVTTAVSALEEDEESLLIAEASLRAASTRVFDEVSAVQGEVTATTAVMVSLDREIVDSTALDAALDASADFTAVLDGIALPRAPEPYERGRVDTESLAEVAAAIDNVQSRLIETDALIAEVRQIGERIRVATEAYGRQLAVFADSFWARATSEIEANPWARQDSYDAVVSAVETVAVTSLSTTTGQDALVAYQQAVLALREDHAAAVRRVEESARVAQPVEPAPVPSDLTEPQSPEPGEQPSDPGSVEPGTG